MFAKHPRPILREFLKDFHRDSFGDILKYFLRDSFKDSLRKSLKDFLRHFLSQEGSGGLRKSPIKSVQGRISEGDTYISKNRVPLCLLFFYSFQMRGKKHYEKNITALLLWFMFLYSFCSSRHFFFSPLCCPSSFPFNEKRTEENWKKGEKHEKRCGNSFPTFFFSFFYLSFSSSVMRKLKNKENQIKHNLFFSYLLRFCLRFGFSLGTKKTRTPVENLLVGRNK